MNAQPSILKCALLVVAKQPAPDQTKTRLTPPLKGEQASALYECFLLDTLDIVRAARARIALTPIIAYLPSEGEGYFRQIAPDFDLLLQEGSDLSERLYHATRHCLTHGFDRAVIMDSDSPSLPPDYLVEAFTALGEADVSLGACDDGGYYLIGLKKPAPSLFLTVTMSTDHVAADTLDRVAQAGWRAHLLPVHYDIDYVSDLRRLIEELNCLPDHIAPRTRAFLQTHPIEIIA
jgi:rSAM/selenodomain-associated transferase 1